jgi:hypothetical protein
LVERQIWREFIMQTILLPTVGSVPQPFEGFRCLAVHNRGFLLVCRLCRGPILELLVLRPMEYHRAFFPFSTQSIPVLDVGYIMSLFMSLLIDAIRTFIVLYRVRSKTCG